MARGRVRAGAHVACGEEEARAELAGEWKGDLAASEIDPISRRGCEGQKTYRI